MAQAFTQGTFYGGSASLATNTTLIVNIVGIDTAPEYSRSAMETTHANTAGTWRTFRAAELVDGGTVSITWQYSTQLDYGSLFANGFDTITVTFPKRNTACGGALATTAATWTSFVVLQKLSASWKLDSQMVITGTFKISGQPVFVAAV